MKALVIAFLSAVSVSSAFAQEVEKETKPKDSSYIKAVCSATIRNDVPLYIVDDVEICAEDLIKIDTKSIESIQVLKKADDIEPYGEKGKNGVILIEMRKSEKKSSDKN